MSDVSPAEVDFGELVLLTTRALLMTTESFEREVKRVVTGRLQMVPVKERMSDQARRVGLLICLETFGRAREGFYVRSQAVLAEALSMDAKDLSDALQKLEGWGLLLREKRDEGIWLQLAPSRLTLADRTLRASEAYRHLEGAADPRQLQMFQKSLSERPDGGYKLGLAAADLEEATTAGAAQTARSASPRNVGSFPMDEEPLVGNLPTSGPSDVGGLPTKHGEFPHKPWGVPPPNVGSSPTGHGESPHDSASRIDMSRGRAPGISEDHKIMNFRTSGSSGAVAPDGNSAASPGVERSRGFRDADKRRGLEEMEKLDPTLAKDGPRRWTWIGRLNAFPHEIIRGLGIAREAGLKGDKAMAAAFKEAREIAKRAGKVLKAILFV